MGRQKGDELDSKAKLVTEICSISATFASCTHRRRSSKKPAFVDWYLILRVEEDAGNDVIRKRYRQLALQLHPDKNKHPKADVAFKLVSEAYACLSDKTKRKVFNSERWKNFCKECSRKCQFEPHNNHANAEKQRDHGTTEHARPYRILKALKEVRNRFKEECRVIENCLRANEASRKELPLFDPAVLLFPDYPHHRTPVPEKPQDYLYFQSRDVHNYWGRVRCESPIYQIRSENQPSRTKNFGFRF